MLRSVGFLLLLLFSVSSSHDAKKLVLAENELQDSSTLTCDGVPSCSRKGDPYKSNGSTIGSEIQSSRLLLMADLDRAASRGVLSPSIPYSQSRPLPSTTILSPAQNMLNNSKLASSANRLTSVFESSSVFSGNLRNKGSNWLLLCTINTPHFCSLSTPHFAVQPLLHPPAHKQFFSKLVLDHMPHLGTPKPSVPPVSLQGVTSKSLIPHAHVHNVPPFKNFHQEANHNGAPYFVIPPSSLTTRKMKHIEAASSPYDSVRSGPSLPLTQDRQSQESLHFGKYTRSVQPSYALPVTVPSLVPMHHGQPQDPSSRRVQAPENTPPVRFLPPSNALPLQALPPIASNGEQTRGPFVNEHQPPRVLPPTLASQGPTMVTSPTLVSSRAQQYQMHPSAFHPVMPNPSNHKIWLFPRVIGTPSQIQSPVEHSRASFSPSGSVSSPHASLPIESPSGHAGTPAFTPSFKGTVSSPTSLPSEPLKEAPSSIFPSHAHRHNMRGPVASSPSIFPSEPSQKKPSVPLAAWAKNISKGQAPVAFAPRIQEHVIPPINPPSKSPIVYSGGSHANHHNMRGSVASSPVIFPTEPPQKKPSVPLASWPKNISRGQAPVFFAPRIQEHVTPPISLPSKPSTEYPGRPHAHHHNMRGSVASSPSIFPSEPPQKKPTVPLVEWPKNISKGQAPIAFAPRIQEHVIPSISPPSKSPMYSGRSHGHHHIMRGSVASSPSIFPSEPPQNKPSVPLAAWPKNISKGQVPVAFAPSIQEHVAPPISLPSEPSMEYPGRSHAHHHNMRGSVASSPSIFPSEPPQKKPTVPLAEWPKNISKGQAPIAFAPRIQEHVIPSISPPSKSPMYSGRSHVHHHITRGSVASSPSIFPFEPPQNKPSVPLAAWPKNISKGQVPVAFAPSIQEHVTPPISLPSEPSMEYPGRSHAHHHNMRGSIASSPSIFPSEPPQKKPTVPLAEWPKNISKGQAPIAFAPRIQEHVIPSISPPSKSPMYAGRSHVHQHITRGSVASSPSIFPSEPPQNKPSVPLAARPKNISKGQVPVAFAPSIQEHVTPPISLPSKPPTEYPGRSHAHHHNMRGSVASSPSIFPSEPPQKKPTVPLAEWPKNISKGQAPIAFAPRIQGHVIPSISPPSKSPMYSGRSNVHHHITRGSVASSPSIFPSEPPQNKPSVPLAARPKNISKGQVPVAFAPSIQEHVTPPISLPSKPPTEYPGRYHSHHHNMRGSVASSPSIFPSEPPQKKPTVPLAEWPKNISKGQAPIAFAPRIQEHVIPPTSPPSKSPMYSGRSHVHHHIVQGSVASSPSIFHSEPPQNKPSVPLAAWPKNISKGQVPVAFAPSIQEHRIPPISLPSKPPTEYPGRPESAPSIAFHSPKYHRGKNVQGPVTSSPSIFPSVPHQKKPSIPVAAQPRSRLKRQTPGALAPKNQEPVAPTISVSSEPPIEYPGTPEASPLIRVHSPPNNQNVKGPSASPPSLSPSISHRQKSIIPVANQPGKRSWRHSPAMTAPIMQGPVSSPSNIPPPEQPNSRTIFALPIVIPSPSHYPRVKGHHTPPRNAPSEPPPKNLRIPVAPPPTIRSQWHAPLVIPPRSRGHFSPPPLASPPEHYRRHSGVLPVPPSVTFPTPPYHQRMKGPVAAPTNIASSKAPEKTPNVAWEAPPRPVSSPFESPKGGTIHPAPAPSKMSPTNHYRGMKGPAASTPRLFPSGPSEKKPSIPMAAPPSKRSLEHAPVASPLMVEGPVSSPFESPKGNTIRPAPAPSKISASSHHYPGMKGPVAPTPRLFPSGPSQKKPSIPMAAPPSKRSSEHAPVASPPMVEGPVSSPFESPKGNAIHPAPAPSKISPSTHHYRGMKGPVASTPRLFPSGPSQKKPSIPMTAPPSKISSEHAPVASPPMVEGPVYSPVNHPLLSPSANLRPPAVSPSIRFPSPPHHRHMKGPVASTPRMIPSVPAQKKPSIPMAAPPNKSSLKHTPVASPPMVEGNLRPPAVSPSIRFPSPPHHRRVKGPVYSPAKSPLPSPVRNLRPPAASPSFSFPSPRNHRYAKGPSAPPPNIASSEPPQTTRGIPLAAPPLVFPPPPPAQDCSSISCTQPLTSTPPGAPCGCVYPMQVELELGVALYAFFPLVSELAAEIAAGTFLKQSQVRIMGANADSQDQEKTIVMLDLVPLGEKFDNTTAFLIFERFWQKKVIINGTLFGDYWVILVYYPGLPPPPPSAFSNANIDGEPTNSNGPGKHEPLGVDINKRGKKMGAGIIVVVSLSSAFGAVICVGAVWITVLKCKNRSRPTSAVVEPTIGSSVKRSGVGGGSILSGSMASSTSMSFASSMAPYTGSAKTLTIAELERATDRFNPQNILGEGGFGRVYRGVLEDGTKVAVKVLTRDDQQGGREFIAEVEMLSRLHHRNLVKLIGICTEEHNRSLVYELIPNGSVESHLHGVDKETAPLDWDARIKIALGAARGLAYLHEDSSPRVIHRDFKASNILLEDDFTPKVSDFGLAKSASEEVSGHISTRVMGTFGYVAPEYAMTGHLLVKSDVYSYGVVLLELLTGRKPVDMSQPPGQENLVTWARPLLTSKEGLEALVDPALGNSLPFDNIARVAAIASMCVQPEVSHRPFMGEVVQALKLVYNDSDASNGGGSGSFSHGGESNAHDIEVKDDSSQQWPQSIQYVPDGSSFVTIDYDSGPLRTQGLETERPLSASALLSTSGSSLRQLSGSFRRHSSSGPLRTNKSKKSWHGIRGLAGGSISEHGVKRHEDVHELWP